MSSKPPPGSTRPKSKAQLRRELESATRRFLSDGGEVERIPAGVSHWQPGDGPPPAPLFGPPQAPRTPLHDVVATLEARRRARRTRAPQRPRRPPRGPRERVIYDDFGEPLRRVWETED